jgi:hypothetical protein
LFYDSLQVKQLKDWLESWEQVHNHPAGGKKKVTASSRPKAALLSGDPGIGKTTAARLVCEHLGFHALEVIDSQSPLSVRTAFLEGEPYSCIIGVLVSAWYSNMVRTICDRVLARLRSI